MRILFIGDVVGRPGRQILTDNLSRIRKEQKIDAVICNGENCAGGNGITRKMAKELFRAGVDAITMGDHLWDQRCFESEIDDIENLCRPANIPQNNPGKKYLILEIAGKKLGVFNLLGQTLVKIKADCPFAEADRVLAEISDKCDFIFVDFHAETSSEKMSMGWHLDGRVGAVVGTHTHIPTADARILPKNTAYLSDAGMTGSWNSCLGRDSKAVLQKFIDGRPRAFTVAEGDEKICACIIETSKTPNSATSIESFIYPPMRSKLEKPKKKASAKKPAKKKISEEKETKKNSKKAKK